MEPLPPQTNDALSADEWLVILAYRRCCDRRKVVIQHFANELAGEEECPPPSGDVIPFPTQNS